MKRVRLVGVTLHPAVLIDDGDHLTPVEVNTVTVPAARLDDVPRLLRDALAGLQAQIDETPEG